MTVGKVVEITSSSAKSFDDAIAQGIERANKTLKHIKGAWVGDQSVAVDHGKITEYRVRLMVTFMLED